MSQAVTQPISNFAQFNRITTVTGDMLDTVFPDNAPYALIIDGQQVFADPRRKGEPGDKSSSGRRNAGHDWRASWPVTSSTAGYAIYSCWTAARSSRCRTIG